MEEFPAGNVRRTGRTFSFSSSEFEIVYPDGHVGTLWSPPWHEWPEEEEFEQARQQAQKLFAANKHRD